MHSRRAPFAVAALLATAPAALAAGPSARPLDLVDRSCRLPLSASATDAPPYGDPPCPGVRPGAEYLTKVGACTLGFVFTGSDRATYVATAGHCALDTVGEATWRPGAGPLAGDPVTGREFGRFVYAVNRSTAADFALIRVNRGVKVDPQMCHFGGPVGIAGEVSFDPVSIVHYGNGYGMDYAQARTSYAPFGLRRPDAVTAYGATSIGDSGAAANTQDGRAVGIVTQLVANGNGNMWIQRLGPHLEAVRKRLGLRLTLRTAPLL